MKKTVLFIALAISINMLLAQEAKFSENLINRFELRLENDQPFDKTAFFREVVQNWDNLSLEARKYFAAEMQRPVIPNEETYKTEYFVIHYTTSGDMAVDDTDNDLDGVVDYVQNIAMYLDEVHEKLKAEGYVLPPPDGDAGGDAMYDAYLSEIDKGTYGSVTADSDVDGYIVFADGTGDNPNSSDVSEYSAATSYMMLRPNYDEFSEGTEVAVKSTVVHEYMHSIQYASTLELGTWLSESFAVWSEIIYYPSLNGFQQYTEAFSDTDLSMNYNQDDKSNDGKVDDFIPWYGQWPMAVFLTNKFGQSFIKEFYNKVVSLEQVEGFESSVYNDYTLLNDFLITKGSSFKEIHNEYLVSFGIMDSNPIYGPYNFPDAERYDTLIPNFIINSGINENYEDISDGKIEFMADAVTYKSDVDGDGKLMRLGADYIHVNAEQAFEIVLETNSSNAIISGTLLEISEAGVNVFNNIASTDEVFQVLQIKEFNENAKYVIIVANIDFENNTTNSQQYSIKVQTPQYLPSDATSISESEVNTIAKVYPNPVQGILNVELASFSNIDNLIVQNALGQTIISQQVDGQSNSLDLNHLNNGLYFIVHESKSGRNIQKVTVK